MKILLKQIMARYRREGAPMEPTSNSTEKYKKSGLTQEQALVIKQRIDYALGHEKLYRNNEIGLGDLATFIQQDRYKVSEVINTYYAKNFYALLSSYRIEEAKNLLINNPMLSVKPIMYEVGFNSKNSFYMAFKRNTGVSPNDFRIMTAYNFQGSQLAS